MDGSEVGDKDDGEPGGVIGDVDCGVDFGLFGGLWFQTDRQDRRQMDGWMDISDCRVFLAAENLNYSGFCPFQTKLSNSRFQAKMCSTGKLSVDYWKTLEN